MSIVGIGTIKLVRHLVLDDVLYIPQFKFNLLSVSCLTKSMDCRVWFDEQSLFWNRDGGNLQPNSQRNSGMKMPCMPKQVGDSGVEP